MSGCPRLVWALYRPDLSCGARNVLVHMANVCDPQLICRDPMTKIARLFGMSVRTVMRYVRELEERGFVETRRRFREVNAYRVLVPESEDAKRANGPASYRNGHDISTQPLNGDKTGNTQPIDGDKSGITQPLDGDKMRTSAPVNGDKIGQSGPIKGDKNGTLESPSKESPRKAIFSKSELEGSKPAREERQPTVAEIEAKRREYAASLAALPAPLADALGKLEGKIGKIAYAPGRSPRLTVEEQIATATPRHVRAFPLRPDQLALMPHRQQAVAFAQAHA